MDRISFFFDIYDFFNFILFLNFTNCISFVKYQNESAIEFLWAEVWVKGSTFPKE